MRKVESAIKEEIQAIRDKVGPELARLEILGQILDQLKTSKNGTAPKAIRKRRKENRPGLGQLPDNEVKGSEKDKTLVFQYVGMHQDCTRREIEKESGAPAGMMSTLLAELVKEGRVEQTNLPAQRGTTWGVCRGMILHAGQGQVPANS